MTSADLVVHLQPPPGWVEIPQEPADEGDATLLVLAPAPDEWPEDWGLRPSIVVAAGAPLTGSIRATASATVATLLALDEGHRVVSYDLWGDDEGRRVLTTYPSGGALVCATSWMRLHDGQPLSVTATVDADRYLRVMPLIEKAVATLRVEPGGGGVEPAGGVVKPAGGVVEPAGGGDEPAGRRGDARPAADAVPEGLAEPRPDEHWARHGETLEDLSRLHAAQPWAGEGLALSRAAFAAFALAGRGLRGPRVRDAEAAAELERAGLVDASGRLTEDGASTHAVLARADRRIRVETVTDGVPGTYEAARYAGSTVVWATASPQSWAGRGARGKDALESATSGVLQWIPTMHLPAEIAAWLGVGPAWPMATSPAVLPRELVTARADDATVPPPEDADDHLRAVWAEPWSTWSLTADTGHAVAGLHAGRHGHLRLLDEGEGERGREGDSARGPLGHGIHGPDAKGAHEPAPEGEVVHLQAWPAEHLFRVLVGVSLL